MVRTLDFQSSNASSILAGNTKGFIMSEKFSDLTLEELEMSIQLFEIAQARSGEDKILQNQIDELRKEFESRLKPLLAEKVLLKE